MVLPTEPGERQGQVRGDLGQPSAPGPDRRPGASLMRGALSLLSTQPLTWAASLAAAAVGSTIAGIGVLMLGGDLIAYMVAGVAASAIVTLASWRSTHFPLDRAAMAPRLLLDLARCGLPFLGWNFTLQIYGEVDKL